MRQRLRFLIPAAIVILGWSSIALAQAPGRAQVEDTSAAYLEQLRVLADEGERDAQFRLGQFYEEGSLVDRDQGKAIQLYLQAAEQGHAAAQHALGQIYHLGNGVERDKAAAMVCRSAKER